MAQPPRCPRCRTSQDQFWSWTDDICGEEEHTCSGCHALLIISWSLTSEGEPVFDVMVISTDED